MNKKGSVWVTLFVLMVLFLAIISIVLLYVNNKKVVANIYVADCLSIGPLFEEKYNFYLSHGFNSIDALGRTLDEVRNYQMAPGSAGMSFASLQDEIGEPTLVAYPEKGIINMMVGCYQFENNNEASSFVSGVKSLVLDSKFSAVKNVNKRYFYIYKFKA